MPPALEKVTAFITRRRAGRAELLLFRHPYAGIQLPAGTVDEGEGHADAALREAREETGLEHLEMTAYVGLQAMDLPEGKLAVITPATVYARPDRTSFGWATVPRGFWVDGERYDGAFTQIAYREYDNYLAPTYLTYSIIGWVSNAALSRRQHRYFYHLAFTGDSADAWDVAIDHHVFHLFWAPLAALPAIIEPQQQWLEYLTQTLGYDLSAV